MRFQSTIHSLSHSVTGVILIIFWPITFQNLYFIKYKIYISCFLFVRLHICYLFVYYIYMCIYNIYIIIYIGTGYPAQQQQQYPPTFQPSAGYPTSGNQSKKGRKKIAEIEISLIKKNKVLPNRIL